VITVAAEGTLRDAVGRFFEEGVGRVVLVENPGSQTPVGILTARDVLRATYDLGDTLSAIGARSAASSPLVTVEPDRTVGHAVDRMADADVRHLPVVEEFDVVGMLTITDVAAAYDEVRDEAMELVGARADWNEDD
jgi:CBS domain-containing protein